MGDFWCWHGWVGVENLANAIRSVPDAEDLDFYIREALFGEAKVVGNGLGDIEHAAADEGSAVINADFDRAAVFEIGDANDAGDGQRFVGGDFCPWPEFLTGGRLAGKDEEMLRVVRCDTDLCVANGIAGLHGMISNAANCVGLGFVAFDVRPEASRERQAECGDESEEESLLKNSFHGVVRGFNNCNAAIREEGMRPQ